MRSVLIIGMGNFGKHLAIKMAELKNAVMIVDKDAKTVEELSPIVTEALVGDCTNEAVLRALGVRNFDICIVAIGDDFQASLEITAMLKEMGAKHVVSKANRDDQARFLLKIGADQAINLEKEMAERLAMRYSSDRIYDYVELTPEYSMFEIPVLEEWIGSSIRKIAVRTNYRVSILAIKQNSTLMPLPGADYVFLNNDHLLVFGKASDVNRITAK